MEQSTMSERGVKGLFVRVLGSSMHHKVIDIKKYILRRFLCRKGLRKERKRNQR